jgi:splicing factor 1
MRLDLTKQRAAVYEKIMALNPQFRAPSDFKRARPQLKLYVPVKEFPGFNFIGLIIGPRGE